MFFVLVSLLRPNQTGVPPKKERPICLGCHDTVAGPRAAAIAPAAPHPAPTAEASAMNLVQAVDVHMVVVVKT